MTFNVHWFFDYVHFPVDFLLPSQRSKVATRVYTSCTHSPFHYRCILLYLAYAFTILDAYLTSCTYILRLTYICYVVQVYITPCAYLLRVVIDYNDRIYYVMDWLFLSSTCCLHRVLISYVQHVFETTFF